jgi:glutathione S-transferase
MKLYFSKGACSLASRIIINELSLPCEFESVDLASKKTETGKNFYTINPKGYVPTLITDNNETLTENAVIMQYLADTAKAGQLLPPVGQFDRYKVLEWLNYVATELHKSFGPLFNSTMSQEVKDKSKTLINAKLGFINSHLENSSYLDGNHFTLPDAYLFVILRWAAHFKMNIEELQYLSRYFSELFTRKAIQQSLKEEGLQVAME